MENKFLLGFHGFTTQHMKCGAAGPLQDQLENCPLASFCLNMEYGTREAMASFLGKQMISKVSLLSYLHATM